MLYFRTKAYTGTVEQFFPDKLPWPDGVKVKNTDFWNEPHPDFYFFDGADAATQIDPGDYILQKEWHRYTLSKEYFEKYYEIMEGYQPKETQ